MSFDINAARKEGYSDQEIEQFLTKNHPEFDIPSAIKEGYSLDEISNRLNLPNEQPEQKGLLGKAWDAFAIPEQKSREGLNMIAQSIPDAETSSYPLNVALNTPKVAAETLAEVAPSFISRGAMIGEGLSKAAPLLSKPVNAIGRWLGKTAESTSGLSYNTPGVLVETVNDPSLLWGKGKQAARELYKDVQNPAQISPDLKELTNNKSIIQKALELYKSNSLTPDEALIGRQAVDQLPEKLPGAIKTNLRNIFDFVAKNKFSEADKAYARAVKSEALRSFWGINKTGTPSIVKGALSTSLPFTAPLFSPVIQGGIAAGIGGLKPLVQTPGLAAKAGAVINYLNRK